MILFLSKEIKFELNVQLKKKMAVQKCWIKVGMFFFPVNSQLQQQHRCAASVSPMPQSKESIEVHL